jgi:hypothetical protein
MTLHVEVPLEEGELIAQALERAVAAGEAAAGIEFESPPDRVAETSASSWRAQQADALVAVAKAYLAGGEPSAEVRERRAVYHLRFIERRRTEPSGALAERLPPGDTRRIRRRRHSRHGMAIVAAHALAFRVAHDRPIG